MDLQHCASFRPCQQGLRSAGQRQRLSGVIASSALRGTELWVPKLSYPAFFNSRHFHTLKTYITPLDPVHYYHIPSPSRQNL